MTDTLLNKLKRVRARLYRPHRWTKGTNARAESGNSTPPTDPGATCWCLAGAAMCEDGWLGSTHQHLRNRLAAFNHGQPTDLEQFNDDPNTTHVDILLFLDRVIEEEKAKQR